MSYLENFPIAFQLTFEKHFEFSSWDHLEKPEKVFYAKLVATTITVYGIWQQNKKDGQLCYVWYIILCNMHYKNLEIIDSSF